MKQMLLSRHQSVNRRAVLLERSDKHPLSSDS